MDGHPASPQVIPIRTRISALLDEIGQTPGWLAERAGLERSTVKRIVDGSRNPTAGTLADLAPVLGVTLEELVAGTDAAGRVEGGRRVIERRHYEDAVRQFVEAEHKVTDLSRRLREAEAALEKERTARKEADKAHETTAEELSNTKRKLEDALRLASQSEQEARKYSNAHKRVLLELADLKTKGEELAARLKKVGDDVADTKLLAAISAFGLAVTAAISLNSYLKDDSKVSEEPSTQDKKGRTRTSKT